MRRWSAEYCKGFAGKYGGAPAAALTVFAVGWVPNPVPAQACGDVLEGRDFGVQFVVLLEKEYLGGELESVDESLPAPSGVDGDNRVGFVRPE